MPDKSKSSSIVAGAKPVRRPKAASIPVPEHLAEPHVSTSEMLRQIKIRGNELSSKIEQLLVRLG